MTLTNLRRRSRPAKTTLLLAAASLALATPVAAESASPAPSSAALDRTHTSNELVAVSADSGTDAWAVGYRLSPLGYERSLVQHWDGSGWRSVKTPDASPYGTSLRDVAALGPSDVWTVGSYSDSGVFTLAEHWDGNRWVQHTTRNPGYSNRLNGVSAVSADDIWAVGSFTNGEEGGWRKTLAQHWDGSRWSRVPTPNTTSGDVNDTLTSVTAVAAADVWAVGNHEGVNSLIEHWNGRRWRIVPADGTASTGDLRSVDAVSVRDVWAVGNRGSSTFTAHWDGDAWTTVPSPNGDGEQNVLNGVSAVSGNDVWAVGRSGAPSEDGATLVEHWDGSSWTVVDSPSGGPYDNTLLDVSAVSQDHAWAVGTSYTGWDNWYKTVIHWDGDIWSQ